ncbi:hypothetical protein LTR37_003397 [Vermiconidia calcicola]|uniref:Uncharacterized protein n=1 Tax=Vermiconidia calcicola TaxID=1690605 RepID=A0ACC3NRY9_9PEZI|nr:hypothetical protein LTR37_003397 [Vermiconidia calcicola]
MSILALAIVATLTLAAPTPPKAVAKRSFKVGSKGRPKLAPADEMFRAYNKHGWEIVLLDPVHDWPGLFPSAPAYGYPSSSVPAPYPHASSSSPYAPSSALYPFLGSSSAAYASSGYGTGYQSSSVLGPLPSQPAPFSSALAASSAVPSSSGYSGQPSGSSEAPSGSGYSGQPSASTSAPPASSSAASGGTDEGEVGAIPEENESQYLAPVTIGGQKVTLNFDTGSADLWVFSNKLPSDQQAGHAIYDPSKSSTSSTYQGGSWEIQYGDGSTASGSVAYDSVNVGGVVAKKQAVELAETISSSFLETADMDGLLGLAFSTINTVQPQQQKTFFENVMDELEKPLFTADLEEDTSGTYEFGTIDVSKYTGEIHYAPISTGNGWWEFESQTYTVGSNEKQCVRCSPTIADTGTSLVLMDNDVVEGYYNQVNGAQYDPTNYGIIYPCSASLPDFGIAIGSSYTAVIKGSDMTYAEIGDGTCFGGLQTNDGAGVNIIGDVFLKQYFAVFDAGNMQFGVAQKA